MNFPRSQKFRAKKQNFMCLNENTDWVFIHIFNYIFRGDLIYNIYIYLFNFWVSRLHLLVQIPFLLSWVDPFAYCKGFGPLPLRFSITTNFACGLYPTFNQHGLYAITKSKGSINTLKASCERNVKWFHFKGSSITIIFQRSSKDTMIKGASSH